MVSFQRNRLHVRSSDTFYRDMLVGPISELTFRNCLTKLPPEMMSGREISHIVGPRYELLSLP